MGDKKKVRISQCMIVKNEERNIEKALTWGKNIVDEQIVVDTGSDDRTVEIAKKMGAAIYYFEWINDFAAAKNYAIEQATGDWIAFLDADEYMTDEDARQMRRHIENYIEKYGYEDQPDAITCKLIDLGSGNSISTIASQNRFFRNNGVKYRGKVHEAISKDGPMFIKEVEDAKIYHTGYQKEAIISQKKGQRNVELIERELELHPDSYDLKSYLVDSLLLYVTEAEYAEDTKLMEELKERAKALTIECMEHLSEKWSYQRKTAVVKIYFLTVLKEMENSEELDEKIKWGYQKCQNVMAENGDVDYFAGLLYYENLKKYDSAVIYFEKGIKKLKISGIEETNNNGYLKSELKTVYFAMTAIYLNKGVNSQALKCIVLAIQMDKFNITKIQWLLNILALVGVEDIEKEVKRLFEQIYDYTNPKDKVFVYSLANKLGMNNLATAVRNKMNDFDMSLIRK